MIKFADASPSIASTLILNFLTLLLWNLTDTLWSKERKGGKWQNVKLTCRYSDIVIWRLATRDTYRLSIKHTISLSESVVTRRRLSGRLGRLAEGGDLPQSNGTGVWPHRRVRGQVPGQSWKHARYRPAGTGECPLHGPRANRRVSFKCGVELWIFFVISATFFTRMLTYV